VLPLRITEEELIVYGSDLEVLARHRVWPRSTTGQRSELPEHRPQEDGKQREAHLRQCFAELGPAASRFLEGLLKTHRMGKDQASRVLALLETYRKTDVANALERAARFGAFSLRAVERILAAQAQPKTPLESLDDQQQQHLGEILNDRPVPPRPTADYEQLYLDPQEPPDDVPPPETPDPDLVIAGQSGVGKSRIVQSVGRAACAHGYRVRYTTSAELLRDLTASLADHSLHERLRYYSNFDLLAIDEFGFDRIERAESGQAASLLYKVVDSRGPTRSTAMVTNISFEAWADYLGDAPLAMAILDRLVDGAIVLKIEGRSYRASRVQRPVPVKADKAAKQRPRPTP
jgi:hypothetical protein